MDSSQLPCPLSTPSKVPCSDSLPRDNSQGPLGCAGIFEPIPVQEAVGVQQGQDTAGSQRCCPLAACPAVGENKEGKVLGEFLVFQTEEKFSRRELWLGDSAHPEPAALPHGSGAGGMDRAGRAPVWAEHPRDELPWPLRSTELFLSLSVSPLPMPLPGKHE